jgi:hypothetical protein
MPDFPRCSGFSKILWSRALILILQIDKSHSRYKLAQNSNQTRRGRIIQETTQHLRKSYLEDHKRASFQVPNIHYFIGVYHVISMDIAPLTV